MNEHLLKLLDNELDRLHLLLRENSDPAGPTYNTFTWAIDKVEEIYDQLTKPDIKIGE